MASGLSTRSAAVLLAGVVLAWGTNWPVTKLIVQGRRYGRQRCAA